MRQLTKLFGTAVIFFGLTVCNALSSETSPHFDTLIRGGIIYDGAGNAPFVGDLGITDDRITALGALQNATADTVIDAQGKAVSPG